MGDFHVGDYRGVGRPWARVAAVAARQHHLLTLAQLLDAGLSRGQVARAVRTGRLFGVHHEVYAVGAPATSDRSRWMAVVLATGGVLSHRSAAALWGVWENVRTDEHVIVPRSAKFVFEGIRPHRPRTFDRERDAVVRDRIAVTTVPRTLQDLAAEVAPKQLAGALQQARVDGLVTDAALRDVLARYPRHRGTGRLGLALTGPWTRSELERRFVRLCVDHGLPTPACNVLVAGMEVDALFADHGVAVELDGRQHGGRWAEDAAKDAALRALGLTVLRFVWWDVSKDHARTAARLRPLLGRPPRR